MCSITLSTHTHTYTYTHKHTRCARCSLSWFISLFVRAITNSARSDALARRLEAINSLFTYMLYTNVCRCVTLLVVCVLLLLYTNVCRSLLVRVCPFAVLCVNKCVLGAVHQCVQVRLCWSVLVLLSVSQFMQSKQLANTAVNE